jgi:hypothetical protein
VAIFAHLESLGMLSRALILAAVMLLIGGFEADPARAQATNLEAGKSPSQIFAGTCTACHKGPRGLLKTISPGSLPGFLRQHYTTSSEMAGPLAAYLISNGASDNRAGAQSKQGEAKPGAKPEPQQAARPDADGILPQGQKGKRLARPGEGPEGAKPEGERGPEGRKGRLSKRGKPENEEPPKTDAAKGEPATGEPASEPKGEPKNEPKNEPKGDTAREEGNKPEGVKPSGEAKSEPPKSESPKSEPAKPDTAKVDAPKASGEPTAMRPDPVPAVTPAPKAAEGETRPVQTSAPAPSSTPAAPAGPAEPASPPPAVTASAPPPAPPASAGPPAPPISQ